jgi:acetyl-CoA acyltransferase
MKAKTMGEKLAALRKLRMKDLKPRIGIVEGLTDPFCGLNMGQTAEKVAKDFGITREAQDRFAIASHEKTLAAIKKGVLAEETTPVYLPPDYSKVVTQDAGPREGLTMEKMAKLKPFFDRAHGSVTVGNSCPITDGAVSLLIMEENAAIQKGYQPLARIRGYAFAGLEPERMGLGPVYATAKVLDATGLTMKEIERVELNEAFAAQVLGCQIAFNSETFAKEKLGRSQPLGELRDDVLNVNGGAIALGHPVGATGSRLVLTLAKELVRSGKKYGLATLCIGGGQGGAMIIENMRL